MELCAIPAACFMFKRRPKSFSRIADTHMLAKENSMQHLPCRGNGLPLALLNKCNAGGMNDTGGEVHHSKRWSELRVLLGSRLLPRRCRMGLYSRLGVVTISTLGFRLPSTACPTCLRAHPQASFTHEAG